MNAREYLGQLLVLDTKINQKIEEYNMLKGKATSTGGFDYAKERVQTSVSDKLGNTVIRYVALNEEINREIDAFYDAKHKIINEIQSLNENNYIQLLFKIHVQFLSLKTVSNELGFSYDYTRELHKKALQSFEDKYKNLEYHT
jgi:ABC-type Zn uptake system ZnuABC Zn-binding protein ZnuA